ncbi:unnamed protein product [Adineta ricciae]|uniref:Uncharacterized protein n=1 Tax=Adineta ricciae TaxID=249248 RepID=A0A815WY15_ADIRI|nr:unnamed protein product [Adineta ricciae]
MRFLFLTNTCSIDSALFAIYVIFWTESSIKSVILNSETEPFLSLRKTFALVESNGWDEAKLYWLTSHSILTHQQSNQYNIYGSVDNNVLRFIKNPVQLYKNKSICSRQDCSTRESTENVNLSLKCSETSIPKFSSITNSRCGNFAKRLHKISIKEAIQLG